MLLLTLYALTALGLASRLRTPSGRSWLDALVARLAAMPARHLVMLALASVLICAFAFAGIAEVSLVMSFDIVAYMEAATALWLVASAVRLRLVAAQVRNRLRALLRRTPPAVRPAARPRAINDNGPSRRTPAAKADDEPEPALAVA